MADLQVERGEVMMEPSRQAARDGALSDLAMATGALSHAVIKLAQYGDSPEYRAVMAAFGAADSAIRATRAAAGREAGK
jgi:hypothetical protein